MKGKKMCEKKDSRFLVLTPSYELAEEIPNYTAYSSADCERNRRTRIVISQLIGTYRFLCNDAFT